MPCKYYQMIDSHLRLHRYEYIIAGNLRTRCLKNHDIFSHSISTLIMSWHKQSKNYFLSVFIILLQYFIEYTKLDKQSIYVLLMKDSYVCFSYCCLDREVKGVIIFQYAQSEMKKQYKGPMSWSLEFNSLEI